MILKAIALLSQEGSVIAFCDDARGGSLAEILQNAFLKGEPMEPPPHDLDCCLDHAALLTREGHSAILDATVWQAGGIVFCLLHHVNRV